MLADRDIQTTFKRIWRKSTIGEKLKLLYQVIGSLIVSEKDISSEEIEKMKSSDMLDSALSIMGETFPLMKEVLIDERDVYLANKIKNAPGNKIVAVLGAGHVPGVIKHITEEKYSVPQKIPVDKFENKVLKKMAEDDKIYLQDRYSKEEGSNFNYPLKDGATSVKNTRNRCRMTVTIIRFADHLWTLRMNHPKLISWVIRATLS